MLQFTAQNCCDSSHNNSKQESNPLSPFSRGVISTKASSVGSLPFHPLPPPMKSALVMGGGEGLQVSNILGQTKLWGEGHGVGR